MLWSKRWIEQHLVELTPWQQLAYQHFSNVMSDKQHAYPCVPGRQGFLTDTFRFGFADDPRNEEASAKLAGLLKQYGEISRDTGTYASLVVFFNSDERKDHQSIDSYQDEFWSLLNRTHKLDEAPWPGNIAMDPHHHLWKFCFDGEPYFVFCATPAHNKRKSRYFPYFLVAFQPQWVFDEINSSTTYGRKLKKTIRRRLIEYDDLEPHPSLKWYGQEDNYEWKQYYLMDDDSSLSKCPFLNMHKKNKS